MKFLPQNKKKQIWLIAILVIAVGGIVYFNFFTGQQKISRDPIPTEEDPALLAEEEYIESEPGLSGDSGQSEAQEDEIESNAGTSLLPFGKKIKTKILTDDEFLKFQERPELTVEKEQLGKDNLFIDETGALPRQESEGGQ